MQSNVNAASHRRTPLQEPKVEESYYILMRKMGSGSRARCPLQGPQLEGDWRRWEMGSGSSTPRGMARWRPMAMDCHRSCAASDEKSKVLGESADYQGEKVILLLLFYYHFIILSYAATKGQAKESCCPERPRACYPGDDKNPGSSIVEGNRC